MSVSNSQIAKNTAFLYVRMLLVMGVTLYTSRVILHVLGTDNFGIYNLAGGVVVLFTFLSSAMTTATQRYLCTSIGEGNGAETQRLFSSSLNAHIVLIVLLVIIAETLGLWFVRTQLSIPPGREFATEAIYQLSVLTAVLNVYRIPFTAAILAWERMSFFSWSGIVEVLLKVVILWPLAVIRHDKLILYGLLLLLVNALILVWYIRYCNTRLADTRHRLRCGSRAKVKEIFKFAGWSSFSALANIGSRQGLNILVNIFYGVAFNAAIGVMMQVSNTVYQFIQNFMVALNPPLMKEYTRHNYSTVGSMLIYSSKFSFFLMLALSTPIIFNIDPILHLWLKEVPPLTGLFCAFSLVALLPNTIGGPVWTIMQASGRIQRYQMIISSIIVLNIPAYYLILKMGIQPQYTLLVQFATNLAVAFIGAKMSLGPVGISMAGFMRRCIVPAFGTMAICWGILLPAHHCLPMLRGGGVWPLLLTVLAELVFVVAVVWAIGLAKQERRLLLSIVKSKLFNRHPR